MDTDKKALEQVAVDDRDEFDDRARLADVLIISSDETTAFSSERILNDNLYRSSVASNGDQIIRRLKKTWYNIILIDLDSIDVSEDYLARKIRIMEPDIPIIGLGNYSSGPCLDITNLKKPLSHGLLKKYFYKFVSEKEIKVGRKTLYAIIFGGCLSIIFWSCLFCIWKYILVR